MSRLRFVFPLRSILTVLLLAAGSLGATEPPGDRTVVEYWEKWPGFEGEAMQAVVDDFNASQDRIFVRKLTVSRMDQKMMLATAGGVPPDIAGLWAMYLTSYVENNALTPLDKLAREAGIREEDYIPVYWQMCTQKGHLWALPTTPTVTALHWNKKMFREAGLDPEQPPRTLEELEQFNERLTKRNPDGSLAQIGHLPQEPGWWTRDFSNWFGGSVWDGGGRLLLDEQPSRDHFRWAATYPERFGGDAMNRLRGAFGNFASPQNPFFNGKVAMIVQGVWMNNFIRQYAPPDFEYGVAPFPSPAAHHGPPVSIADCDVLAIPKGAKHPKEAMEFIAYTQTQAAMEKLCLGQKKFTPLRAVSPHFVDKHPHPYLQTFIDLANSPNVKPILALPTVIQYSNDLATYMNLLLLGRMSPDEARGALQVRQQRALDKKTERWNRVKEQRLAEWRSQL
ncbi:MAG: ABC transporter substrate-binding protein [Sphaerospermopsis kisseleviana]